MNNIVNVAVDFYKRNEKLMIYGFISIFVTIIDVGISWGGEKLAVLLVSGSSGIINDIIRFGLSNTLGVVTGFIIQYFMSARRVFNSRNMHTFLVYVMTFLLGLILANGIVYVTRTEIFNGSDSMAAFLTAKFFSILVPFFVMYFLRKKLIKPDKEENADK